MAPDLRHVTREFALGEATLETLREAARRDRREPQLAAQILSLIAEWENTVWTDSERAKNEVRARAQALVPPAPPPYEPKITPQDRLYGAGLRGQRERGKADWR